MPPNNVIEFVSKAERNHMLGAAVLFPLARLIQSGSIDPEAVTRSQFLSALRKLGKSHENAFEVYTDLVEEEMRLVAHCIKVAEPRSAIVLLFTLIEGEINTLLRAHLRIRGFATNSISDALRGTDFETKIDVMLPLLEVEVPARIRNVALQCKAIRNLVVHNKATPSLMSQDGDRPSDVEIASERASKFFKENPVSRLQRDIRKLVNDGIHESWAVQWASHLFAKYYVRGAV